MGRALSRAAVHHGKGSKSHEQPEAERHFEKKKSDEKSKSKAASLGKGQSAKESLEKGQKAEESLEKGQKKRTCQSQSI